MTDCLDCKPTFWGNHRVPPRARGYYRTLWQMQDALHCPRRMYPSAFMDCAGFIAKHDCWDPIMLALTFQKVAQNPTFANGQGLLDVNGLDLTTAAIRIAGFAAFYFPNYVGWLNVYRPDLPQKIRMHQFHIISGNFNYFDPIDEINFPYTSPPHPHTTAVGAMLYLAPPDFAGFPWFNAI